MTTPTDNLPAPDAPAKDPIPRNRPVDKAAQALAEKTIVPRPPAVKLSWEQMQEYLALLTPDMWTSVTLYLYRLKPRIIRQLKDPNLPNYIDCVSEPLTMEYLIERHGGGKYLIEASDSNSRRRGESNHLFRCYVVVDEVRYEPKLAYEELDVNNRENMSFIQMLQHRGVLDGKGHPVTNPQPTPGAGAGLNAEVIKEILGFVSKMNTDQQESLRSRLSNDQGSSLGKSVGDILLEKMKQDDPNKQVETLSKLINSVKDMYGTNKAADTTNIYAPFISMLSEQNKLLINMVEKLGRRDNPPEPAGDDLDRIEKLLGVVEKVGGLRGGGGRRGPWDIGLDYAREVGVPLMSMISNLITLRRGPVVPMPGVNPAAAAGAVNGAAPPVGAFDPYANPAALHAYASSLANQPPAPGNPIVTPPPANPAPAAGGADGQLLAVFQANGGMLINALNNNTPGFDFADYIVGLLGAGPHAMISNYGEDTIVRTMLTIPEIAMFGETRLRRFTHEFVNYQEILANQDQESEHVQ